MPIFYANDRNGVFTFVSSSVTAMLGWQPEEFLTHYSQVVSEHPVNQAIEATNAAVQLGPASAGVLHRTVAGSDHQWTLARRSLEPAPGR